MGTWVSGELERVEGKTPKATEARQRQLLTALLEGRSGYADPVKASKVKKR